MNERVEGYFPEVKDEKSSHHNLSPMTAIIKDLRRKNVVTATAGSGHQLPLLDSSDPWGSSEALGVDEQHMTNGSPCACPTKGSAQHSSFTAPRRNSWIGSRKPSRRFSKPIKPKSNSQKAEREINSSEGYTICPQCGKSKAATVDSKSPSQQRLISWLNSTRLAQVEPPKHAEALLQDTPQWRIISPASTDMQGASSSPSNNLLSFLLPSTPSNTGSKSGKGDLNGSTKSNTSDYKAGLMRDRANRQAASELSSLLCIFSHEMSLEEYGRVESEVFASVFSLVQSQEIEKRMAGLAALDALIGAPSADEEKKAVQFANTLKYCQRSAVGDYECLSAVSKAIGHMATSTRTADVEYVKSEVARALEWLRKGSDRRLAAALVLKELAIHAPTAFYSKTSQSTLGHGGSNDFLDFIFKAVRDPQPIVRACAADALSQCLKILMERQHLSLTALLCQVHFSVMEGFEYEPARKSWTALNKSEVSLHGSLMVVGTMIAHTGDFMLPRYDEVCKKTMEFMNHPKALIRLEVIRLLPRLARHCPRVYARRYLEDSLEFLLRSASTAPQATVDLRPSAFGAIGGLVLAMTDADTGAVFGGSSSPTIKIIDNPEGPGHWHTVELSETGIIFQKLDVIFGLVSTGLNYRSSDAPKTTSDMHIAAFHCAADLVEALGDLAQPYVTRLINDMFRTGLSNDLIQCLHAIADCLPGHQSIIEDRLLQEVSYCLAGIKSARDVCDPLISLRSAQLPDGKSVGIATSSEAIPDLRAPSQDDSPQTPRVSINMSANPEVVDDLVLSLQTLSSFGDSMGRVTTFGAVVPLLPFVQNVAAKYLSHPSSDVRRAAALTCCLLLVPPRMIRNNRLGRHSGRIVQDILDSLLRVSISDRSPAVRLCVVRALDARYDPFLCQAHHLQSLFLLLQDEMLATRAAGVRLLGRLASLNPACILPYMRKFLLVLIVELQCGVDTGRGREEATRLLVVFLRHTSLQRLVQPVLPAIVESLPLNGGTPRLASAALEALGELARAAGKSLFPWVKDLVPSILETLQDQSSASKQRISLRALAQIAGSTSYVIQPYIDYPQLLSQATDILPGTKRAPWTLRREVIRTLGVLGALDPDRYHTVAPKARKGGAVGGAYFVVQDDFEVSKESTEIEKSRAVTGKSIQPRVHSGEMDDDLPAHLSMYEQYSMVAQPVSSLPPARRMTPDHEEFYPTVAIQALMRIFKDPSLALHHGMVMQAIMFIFKSLDLLCVPFLSKVVPHILQSIRTSGPSNLRESLLKQVATLSKMVREHLRPYVADIFDIVEEFWPSRHLETIFSLVLHIANGVPDEFRRFVPRLIRRILTNLDEMQVADWATAGPKSNKDGRKNRETERLCLILDNVKSLSLKGVLGEYLHVLVPALLKLVDSMVQALANVNGSNVDWVTGSDLTKLTVLALKTTSALLECDGTGIGVRPVTLYWGEKSGSDIRSGSLSSRVVQPLIRLLGENYWSNRTVGKAIVKTLCVCAKQLGRTTWMKLYHDVARAAISQWQRRVGQEVRGLSQGTLEMYPVTPEDTNLSGIQIYDDLIKELLASPFQRSYNSPHICDGISPLHRPGVMDQQPTFKDNFGISATFDATDAFENPISPPSMILIQKSKQKINESKLKEAWDVSNLSSREDWDNWMRSLGIELLREAPSPALRAAASLAGTYQPLARELFSAAFVCCWKELSEANRENLIQSLKYAFDADVSPEILQTLLNLAEFMEHDPSGGLPIDIPILADLALKCRAYAKALHYKEREHNMGGENSCVESLISINRKLDLQEAALGVLKSATMRLEERRLSEDNPVRHHISAKFGRDHGSHEMFFGVVWSTEDRGKSNTETLDLAENKELWLAKLGSWTDALEAYEEKLARNPFDFSAILGCIECLSATGEWRRVLELAEDNWHILQSNEMEDVAITSPKTLNGKGDDSVRGHRKAFRMCAEAAWRLGRWNDLEKYSAELVHGLSSAPSSVPASSTTGGGFREIPRVDFDGSFFSAVLHVHRQEWNKAAEAIDAARKAMDSPFTALMAESYNRAYPSMVKAQTLAELEEVIEYKKTENSSQDVAHSHPANYVDPAQARERLLSVWRERLGGCRVDAEVHSSILAVRSLVLGPTDEVDATLTLSELSRQAQRFKLAERVLLNPLEALKADLNGPAFGYFGYDVAESLGLGNELREAISRSPVETIIDDLVTSESQAFLPEYDHIHHQWCKELVHETGGLERLKIQHKLYFAYLKHLWFTDRRQEAVTRLARLCDIVDLVSHCESVEDASFRSSCWLELGEWRMEEMMSPGHHIPEPLQIIQVLCEFKRARMMNGRGYKAWHAWALLNFRLALQMNDRDSGATNGVGRFRGMQRSNAQNSHVITAIKGFFNAIGLGTKRWSASVQQDMLNLLTCLFKYGENTSIANIFNECVDSVEIETWLGVLPQLLARIHIKNPSIRSVLHPLLIRLGEKHPQALMYPLSVLLKSPVAERKSAAESLMNSLRSHSSALVDQALLVSSELIRVAILWLETWHEGLEEASRLHYGEGNVSGMLDILLPLHEQLETREQTQQEADFIKAFGQKLGQAHQHLRDYVQLLTEGGGSIPTGSSSSAYDPSGRQVRQNEQAETAMNQAWNIYYTVFRKINSQLPSLTKLELLQCSPKLSEAHSLELGVPGSYRVDGSYVKIEKFVERVDVITSKQRPRKIKLRGSDGQDYVFLLKGHEDLRQDERVMQLFGLVNALLERDRQTKKQDLRIQRYGISPLSHNCGLVGWVPHTDTLHSLIRDYRDKEKKIPINLEHREMVKLAPDYDLLTVMQKVEVFNNALRCTEGNGNDLYEILWLKSTNSEEWLGRRTKYTRSLAVMSMVGYILGLGDRHPSNLMLDKLSGRVLHIDFGDCFEVAMNRDKYPEKVPFRLTRMLIKAMEVSGIEGSYRSTCERTMAVLRESRDSLVALMEAFVHDPLISWRLVDSSETENANRHSSFLNKPITEGVDEDGDALLSQPVQRPVALSVRRRPKQGALSAATARSLQIYSNIQTMAANLSTDNRIASITGGEGKEQVVAAGSLARSRMERSMRQRELLSTLEDGLAHEEVLNEKALKVVRRIQDKLTGTDFPDREDDLEPLDVSDQVQRLIVQATSVENLCQLFIGWCSFW